MKCLQKFEDEKTIANQLAADCVVKVDSLREWMASAETSKNQILLKNEAYYND